MCRKLDDYDTREMVDEIIRRGTIHVDDAIEQLLPRSELSSRSQAGIQGEMDAYLQGRRLTQTDLDRYLKSIES